MNLHNLFYIITVVYLFTSIFYFINLISQGNKFIKFARIVVLFGFLLHSVGLILWTIKAQHAPFSNMYESSVFFSWAIVLVYLILSYTYKWDVLGAFVIPLAFLAIGSASVLPNDYKAIEPLVPALRSSWLEIHVISCMVGYAAFAISFVAGILFFVKEKGTGKISANLPSQEVLDTINYKSITLGFVLLTCGIISGAIWANFAWGTYWSWDPKETWSLITWLIYAIYLHARLMRGWYGKKIAWISIIGFLAVLFTYWGVNFLLSGLHSYAQ